MPCGRWLALLGLQAAHAAWQEPPPTCDVVAVGGGWAGVYFAYRTAAAGSQVCLFEATERIGGRTYSHTFNKAGRLKESFTLDVGAYRFSPDMHLPGDLILKVLRLPTACYEPDCEPANKDFPPPFMFNYTAPLRRIVDAEGMPAGYVTAINGLVDQIKDQGGKVFVGTPLLDLQPTPAGANLVFANFTVAAKQVLLNLPRHSLMALPSLAAATPRRTTKTQACVKFDMPPDLFSGGSLFVGKSLTKAYAFYDDAWWYTKLNMTEGQWPENAFNPIKTSKGIPIGIHFNDGPVRCEAPGKGCRGFLQVFYSIMDNDFYPSLRKDPEHPLGVLVPETDSKGMLGDMHAALIEALGPLFKKADVAPPTEAPVMLVVGVWDRTGQGLTAPTKVYYSKSATLPGGPDPLERACGVPGLTELEYQRSMLTPLGNSRVLVANNDWSALQTEKLFGDWAEESLLQAERGLRLMGLPRPAWLDEAYYRKKVVADASQDSDSELIV